MNVSLVSDGKLYPSLFFASTLTRYLVYFSSCVNRHVLVLDMLYNVQLLQSFLRSAFVICARYPITGSPNAPGFGGLHVTLRELHSPEIGGCKVGLYGTSDKRN